MTTDFIVGMLGTLAAAVFLAVVFYYALIKDWGDNNVD